MTATPAPHIIDSPEFIRAGCTVRFDGDTQLPPGNYRVASVGYRYGCAQGSTIYLLHKGQRVGVNEVDCKLLEKK